MGSKIVIPAHVEHQLLYLYDLLYRQGYFSYKENAFNYVNGIREFIKQIPNLPRRSLKNKIFGQYFRKYVPNRKTTWYIAFEEENGNYMITFITNNHSEDYNRFIRGIR